jgi:uncharacterized protein YndB with AHSA1/START domain
MARLKGRSAHIRETQVKSRPPASVSQLMSGASITTRTDDPPRLRGSVRALLALEFDPLIVGDGISILQGARGRFMCPAEGMTVPKVEVDTRVCGSFLIVMAAGDKEIPHRGEYKTIDRYDRLAFTWLSQHTIPGSLVTIDFREKGPHETEVTLHHVGLPSEESRNGHRDGWSGILRKLATHLG